ncbi:MAG: CpaF family protein [Clostridia bacterium]|nr:CpaF family protein [Clostridia bacterium]
MNTVLHTTLAMPAGTVRDRIAASVLDTLSDRPEMDDRELKRVIARTAARELTGSRLALAEQQHMIEQLFHSMRGYDVLQPLMDDPDVTEIMVNGPDHVYYESCGKLRESGIRFDNADHLANLVAHLFSRGNRMVSHASPIADIRLPDGSRANAVLPPVAPDGPILTIRRFTGIRLRMDALVREGTLDDAQADYLARSVRERRSIFICGGTGSGKTTFLNILSSCIPPAERVVTIEDSAELSIQGPENIVRLEARTAGPDGTGEVGLDTLVRTALRLRPDRIIIGEVRGPEAAGMLQALNTGHKGSLCTGHGNSCKDMLLRLATLAQGAARIPYSAILRQVGTAVDLVVHMERRPDGRRTVDEIRSVIPDDEHGFRLLPVRPGAEDAL